MCNDYVSNSAYNRSNENFFIKLLMLTTCDQDFVLLYGFCVPTNQSPYPWKHREIEKKQQSIWSAILSPEDRKSFIQSLTVSSQIALGGKCFNSPELVKRPVVLSGDGQNRTQGPVSSFSRVSEYWNVDKKSLFQKIQSSFCVDGKELYQCVQNLLVWVHEECGIDFSKNAMRVGNFEVYDFQLSTDIFNVKTDKEFELKKTTISKKISFSRDLIVNCRAEHRGRSISNQTRFFPAQAQHLDFFADEPMTRVVIQIWEAESGNLVFSKDSTLITEVSLALNIGSPTYQIRDPWSDKLFASAANRSDIIKKQIETVSKSSKAKTLMIKSSTHNAIDEAIKNCGTLFSGYQQCRTKGAFIPKIQKDGEINSFLKIREYIESPSVKRAIIVDPYFSVESAIKLLTRISREDVQVDIITALTDTDPDTNKKTDICKKYREFINSHVSILHGNLSIRNLTRGKTPVFHDRYLIRFFDDGRIDGFLLSNSLNSMGQFYPFVVAPMDQVVCYEVCDYLETICDPATQAKLPEKDRIVCDVLCDFHNNQQVKTIIKQDALPFNAWLAPWCVGGTEPNIPRDQLREAVNKLWGYWHKDKTLTCKMISQLGLTTYPWSAEDLSAALKKIDNAKTDFLEEFVIIAAEKEQQQNHAFSGLHSDAFALWSLLNGQAKPSKQGFSKLFDEAGHLWYPGSTWLKGGYMLMLQLDPPAFIMMLDKVKSPLMFDVLASQMLFRPWDEKLFFTSIKSNNLCLKLLCAEYVFHQIVNNNLSATQINEVMCRLSPEISSLQLSYLLSQFVFHVRATRLIKLEEDINFAYDLMLKKLAHDLPQCNEEAQEITLDWLYDCEICSNCQLHLDLAAVERDPEVKRKIYNKVASAAERNLIRTTYERDVTKLADLYLQAMDALYGDMAEKKFLGKIIDWRVFEIATEPALSNYAYPKWSDANTRAQWQIYILNEYVSHHPSASKTKEWLEYWEPRVNVMNLEHL